MNLVLMSQQPGGVPKDHFRFYDFPKMPRYKAERLMKLKPQITKRINELLILANKRLKEEKEKKIDLNQAEKKKLENLLKQLLGKNWIQRRVADVGGWFTNRIIDIGIASKKKDLADATIEYILTDLAEKGLLDLND
jgi:hypothetical protein